jgi:hypothetical protein
MALGLLRLADRTRFDDFIATTRQHALQRFADHVFVLDQQDFGHGGDWLIDWRGLLVCFGG